MKLLHTLGEEAAGHGAVSRASFIEDALRELSVGLLRGNCDRYQAAVGMIVQHASVPAWPGPRITGMQNSLLADY
jgi:hypothetical protein